MYILIVFTENLNAYVDLIEKVVSNIDRCQLKPPKLIHSRIPFKKLNKDLFWVKEELLHLSDLFLSKKLPKEEKKLEATMT